MLRFGLPLLRLPLLTLALGAVLAPAAVRAQDLPSYARPTIVSTDETIHGRIASVDGTFRLALDDDRGFVDTIALHQGTIINPTGLTLAPGMSVTINGYSGGSVFNANEVDTPYSYSGVLPTPVYYGPGFWAPGFGYGYGPSFSIAFIFGGGYGHFERHDFYGRPWDGSRYFGGYIGRRDFDGNGRGYDGGGRGDDIGVRGNDGGGRGNDGGTRGFSGGSQDGSGHVPAAFDRRSFAGHAYVAGQIPAGYSERYPQTRGGSIAAPARPITAARGYGSYEQRSFSRGADSGGAARPPATMNRAGRFEGGNVHANPGFGAHSSGGGQANASVGHGGGGGGGVHR